MVNRWLRCALPPWAAFAWAQDRAAARRSMTASATTSCLLPSSADRGQFLHAAGSESWTVCGRRAAVREGKAVPSLWTTPLLQVSVIGVAAASRAGRRCRCRLALRFCNPSPCRFRPCCALCVAAQSTGCWSPLQPCAGAATRALTTRLCLALETWSVAGRGASAVPGGVAGHRRLHHAGGRRFDVPVEEGVVDRGVHLSHASRTGGAPSERCRGGGTAATAVHQADGHGRWCR
ncbi:hypothetical protein D1007_20522 [Hordeum vulgare]|nr:hypothetical protein D1007_20522 [Hordeum vulgare]